MARMNPHNSTADLLSESLQPANEPSDVASKNRSCGQITNEEDESLDKKNKCCSDIVSDSNYKRGLNCHQRRTSLVASIVETSSSHDAPTRRTIDLGHGSDLIYIQ
ncbi:hypothetical protein F2Q70_00041435, partial [Brassica cretica]